MIDNEAAVRQLVGLAGIAVPEDEIPDLMEGLTELLERIESVYSVEIGDTPPTAMLRVEA